MYTRVRRIHVFMQPPKVKKMNRIQFQTLLSSYATSINQTTASCFEYGMDNYSTAMTVVGCMNNDVVQVVSAQHTP